MRLTDFVNQYPFLYVCFCFVIPVAIILGWTMSVIRKSENQDSVELTAFQKRHKASANDLAAYVDHRVERGEPSAKAAFPEVHEHLQECPICAQEVKNLITLNLQD